jgi:DNA polymerase/3'-5' exonuclease PolX
MSSQESLPGVVESIRPTYSRDRASAAAGRLKPLLMRHLYRDGSAPLCRIAGSLRRKCRDVHDVDVVAVVSTVPDDPGAQELSPRGRLQADIKARAEEVVLWGPERARFVFDGVPFDLFFTRPKTFAVALLTATGSGQHIFTLCRRARLAGYRYHPTRHLLTTGDGIPVYVPTEEDFYRRLNMDPVRPENR